MAEQLREALARKKKVMDITGLPSSSLYEKIKAGEFPKPIRLGPRAVAWRLSEVQQWIDDRIEESKRSVA